MPQTREVVRGNAAPLCTEVGGGTAGIVRTVSGGTKVFIWGCCEGGEKH